MQMSQPDLDVGNGNHLLPERIGGQDPLINVAMGHGFADIAPRHKSQRRRGGTPARDQLGIWQIAGMVTHGRGIGPFGDLY